MAIGVVLPAGTEEATAANKVDALIVLGREAAEVGLGSVWGSQHLDHDAFSLAAILPPPAHDARPWRGTRARADGAAACRAAAPPRPESPVPAFGAAARAAAAPTPGRPACLPAVPTADADPVRARAAEQMASYLTLPSVKA